MAFPMLVVRWHRVSAGWDARVSRAHHPPQVVHGGIGAGEFDQALLDPAELSEREAWRDAAAEVPLVGVDRVRGRADPEVEPLGLGGTRGGPTTVPVRDDSTTRCGSSPTLRRSASTSSSGWPSRSTKTAWINAVYHQRY